MTKHATPPPAPEICPPDQLCDDARYRGSHKTPTTPPVALVAKFSISGGRAICLGWPELLAAYERAATDGSEAAQFRVDAAKKQEAKMTLGEAKFASAIRSRAWADLPPAIQRAWETLAAEESRKDRIESENAT